MRQRALTIILLVLGHDLPAQDRMRPQHPLQAPVSGLAPWESLVRARCGVRWVERGAQLVQESGGDPLAVSPVGAKGLMQAMPRTWAWYQAQGWVPRAATPLDPVWAVEGGHRHMLWLEGRFQGDWHAALGAYNAGQGSVMKAQALARSLGLSGQDAWLRALPRVTGWHATETVGYVARIPRLAAEIRRQRRAA